MSDTSALEPKSSGVSRASKLLRMLPSMSRRFPKTSLLRTSDGFGVQLADGSYLRIVYSGHWSDADMRDFLVLFATWLVDDPEYLREKVIHLGGAFFEAKQRSEQLPGRPI